MGRFIIKPDIEQDFYVEWSTIVDNWVFSGTWDEMVAEGIDKDRLDRAKELGSSSYMKDGRWEHQEMIIHNLPEQFYKDTVGVIEGYFVLPRENIIDFVYATADDSTSSTQEILSLLKVVEWD